ncbi:hypothetical protein PVL29_006514 [Vitis rotundifolia]|uniref:PGG domain-containing protein n=1 Tax=Vitis rotundifolia TaxID=103349 RepID=A0AA39A7D5_VITRO|nr:hypothetical protein PVL29_006514 [Vitis rotundifolia]
MFYITKSRHSLQGLVKLLVKQDTSGHVSINEGKIFQEKEGKNLEKQDTSGHVSINEGKIFQEKEGKKLEEKKGQNSTKLKKRDESPLFLATISNIQEIVEEILVCQPQMLENTNKEGMNILQVAILHRCIEIFDMVVKLEVLPSSLLSTTDKEGNSLLHMVGKEKNSQAGERMQTPAFQLQKELLLFQKVKSACKMHLINPLNNDDQTAEELFATSNEDLHKEAKNWLMRTTKNCTILSVFIATVAFAAAYTVPGGPDQKTGIPILNSKPFFVVFIVADVVSLAMALTSTGIFFSILTSSFPLQHFETYLFDKLRQGIICLIFSVSMMAVAFGATIVLLMKHNGVQVLWLAVGFLPVPIFFLSYSPLSSAVLKLVARNRCTESFKNFVAKFLKVVGIVVVLFPFVLFFLLSGAFYGLYWTVKKACEFIICKPVLWICQDKSQLESDTQSPQV